MIEIIYDEAEKEKEVPEIPVKLPKNIRQIGENPGNTKVYIEDYVMTFIHKLRDKCKEVTVGILLGEVKCSGKDRYIFIPGAIRVETEHIVFEDGKICFTEDTWGSIYGTIKEYFNKYMIVGWFVNRNQSCHEIGQELSKTHVDNFPGGDKILFLSDVSEQEAAVYHYESGELKELSAYYIYYERNEDMQEYMVAGKDEPGMSPTEVEVKDAVPVNYRNILKEKKEENSQRRLVGVLYAACTFLAFVILMIGVAMMNNYDKIESLERLVSDMYKTAMGQVKQDDTSIENKQEVPVIDNVEGNVEPTAPHEVFKEQESSSEEETTTLESQTTKSDNFEEIADITKPDNFEEIAGIIGGETTDAITGEGIRYHVVIEGDTLTSISRKFYNTDTMVEAIMQLNEIENRDMIYPGQVINLP